MIEAYKNDIIAMLHSKWWEGKSALEIVAFQLEIEDLTLICDRSVFLKAFEEVFGRPFSESGDFDQEALVR